MTPKKRTQEKFFGYDNLVASDLDIQVEKLDRAAVKVPGLPDRGFNYCWTVARFLEPPYENHVIVEVFYGDNPLIAVPEHKIEYV